MGKSEDAGSSKCVACKACDGWVGEVEKCVDELEKISDFLYESQSPPSVEFKKM